MGLMRGEQAVIKRALRPYRGNRVDAVEGIEYGIWRDKDMIRVEYDLYGMLSLLRLNEDAGEKEALRCERLWEHSCFELFLKADDRQTEEYYECNFSPSGCWNIYSFSSYRTDMVEAGVVEKPSIDVSQKKKIFSLSAEINVSGIIPASQPLDVGVSCVVEGVDGELGYWAISHPREKPDFHDPRSFLKSL